MLSLSLRRLKHSLPDLPYDYNALEPFISAEIMQLHHKKHHQTYVNNLNVAEEKLADITSKKDTTALIALQPTIKFNGGGHINHSIFWTNLAPSKEYQEPNGALLAAINKQYGDMDNFKGQFSNAAASVQGSGWAWLGLDPSTKRLEIISLPNQDPLTSHIPLLGIDVWEHAYYLQYKNVRPDYLKAIWNVINWKNVAHRASVAGLK